MKRLLQFLFGLTVCASSLSAEIIPEVRRYPWAVGTTVGVQSPGIDTVRTEFVNLRTTGNPTYLCEADGTTDDSAHIQQAMIDCPADQYVYMPSGTYATRNQIVVPFGNSDYSLRGEVDGNGIPITTIKFIWSGAATDSMTLGSHDEPTGYQTITAGATKGSTTVTVDDTTAFASRVGENMVVVVSNPPSYVHNRIESNIYTHTMGWVFRIVSTTGTTVTFTPELPLDISTFSKVIGHYTQPPVTGVGIENVKFDGTSHVAGKSLVINNARGVWVKNVIMTGAPRFMLWNNVIFSELRRSRFYDSSAAGSGSESTSLSGHCSWNLIEDNSWSRAGGVALMLGESYAYVGGNVIGYNYFNADVRTGAVNTGGADIDFNHGSHPTHNLIEGNVCGMMQSDSYFGSASHNTVYRNWSAAVHDTGTLGIRAIDLNFGTTFTNVVGNVFGTPVFSGQMDTQNRNYGNGTYLIRRYGYPNMGDDCYGLYPATDEAINRPCDPLDGGDPLPACDYGDEDEGALIDDCTDNGVIPCRNVLPASIPPALPDYDAQAYRRGECGVDDYTTGSQRIDLNVKMTTAWHRNYDYHNDGIVDEDDNVNVSDFTDLVLADSLYTNDADLRSRVVMGELDFPVITPTSPNGSFTQANIEITNAAAYRFWNNGLDPVSGPQAPILFFIPATP